MRLAFHAPMYLIPQVMELFSDQIKFLEKLEEGVISVLKNTINRDRILLEEAVTENQLFERGVDGFDKPLRPYARTTIRLKNRRGQPTDRTTTRDTGAFHASVKVEAFDEGFEVSSPLEYVQYLTKKGNRYGIDILRPSSDNLEIFLLAKYIPELKEEVKNKLNS
jgi:hypothetical protein